MSGVNDGQLADERWVQQSQQQRAIRNVQEMCRRARERRGQQIEQPGEQQRGWPDEQRERAAPEELSREERIGPQVTGTYQDLKEEWAPAWGAAWPSTASSPSSHAATTGGRPATPGDGPGSPVAAATTTPKEQHRVGRGSVRGIARSVQLRSELTGLQNTPSTQVMTFRVEEYDAQGNRLPPVLVELRGFFLSGQVSEGEEVEVRGVWRNGILQADTAVASTGANVSARYLPSGKRRWPAVAYILFCGLFGLFVFGTLVYQFAWGEHTSVPDVVGMDQQAAMIEFEKADLSFTSVEESSDVVPPGRVIRTDPSPGKRVRALVGKVWVYVSTGPLPADSTPPTTLTPPGQAPKWFCAQFRDHPACR